MKTGWACSLAMMLTACAAVPPARPLNPHTDAQAFAARRLDESGLVRAETRLGLPGDVAAPWTPDRITVAAWYFDPILAQAHAAAARAAADATVAAQRVNPTLSLTPEKVFSGNTAATPWTIGVALLLPLLHPGEAAARRAVAAADTAAADDLQARALWQSRARVVAAMRDVLLGRRAQAAALASAQADRGYLDAVRQRRHAGEDDGNAELTAELTMQRAQADLATRKAQRIAAEHALAAAIGVPLAALAGVTLQWPELTAPPAPTALPKAALSKDAAWNRLDLAVLLQHYRAAEAKLREAAGSRYPQLAIAPGYLYDQGQRKFTFGVELKLPLFHGAGARIRAAGAARDEAVAAVHARQDQIINQLDAARADYAQRYAAWRQLSAMAASAQGTVTRAAARRTAGQVDRLTELAARAAAETAQLNAIDALSGTWNALGHLEDVLQRPLWPTSQLSMLQRAMAPSRSFPPSEVEAAHADAH